MSFVGINETRAKKGFTGDEKWRRLVESKSRFWQF